MKKFLLLASLGLAGCGSYPKDLAMVCNASEHAGVLPGDDPAHQAEKISLYIDQHLSSRKGRAFFKSLAGAGSAKDVSRMVRNEAARNGVSSCPLADKQDAASTAFAHDLEVICNSEAHAGVTSGDDAATRLQKLAVYIEKNLQTAQAQKFFTEFGKGAGTTATRDELLREEAHSAGLTSCPLAEH